MTHRVSLFSLLSTALALNMSAPTLSHAQAQGGYTDGGGDALVCRLSMGAMVGRTTLNVLTAPLLLPVWSVFWATGQNISLNEMFTPLTEVYLADTFHHFYGTDAREMLEFGRTVEQNGLHWELRSLMVDAIREEDPELAEAVAAKVANLRFERVDGVPEVEDDGIAASEIPKGCKKRQLALQNLETGVVSVDYSLYDRMSPLEQSLLRIHEAFIALQTPREIAQRNTAKIRERIRALATDPEIQARIYASVWNKEQRIHRDIHEIVARGCNSSGEQLSVSFEAMREMPLMRLFGKLPGGQPYPDQEKMKRVLSCIDQELRMRGYGVIKRFLKEDNVAVFDSFAAAGYPVPMLVNTLRYYYGEPSLH